MTPRGSAAAALAALAVIVLAGCAHLPVGSDGLSYDGRRARLEAVDAWVSRGRLAVDTGDRGFQGSFEWQQDGDALELTVRGPFRQTVLQVTGTPRALTVTAGGETRVLDDPETELSALLGWWLPVGSLHAWLRALPDPQFPADTELGPEGTLAALEQRLWRVEYLSYQLGSYQLGSYEPGQPPGASGASVLVPRRIDLKHDQLYVRLTVDDWHPAPPP